MPAAISPSPRAVVLVGFMGAGKSSVGRALAERLNWLFEDLDDRVERREGRTIAEIFRDSGEAEFRRAEQAALEQMLEELHGGAKIVALGGGAFVKKDNAALLRAAGVPAVFLDARVEELWRRCQEHMSGAGRERPLLKTFEPFRALYQSRRKSYLQARVKIETDGCPVEAIAAEIVERLGLREIGTRTEQGEAE